MSSNLFVFIVFPPIGSPYSHKKGLLKMWVFELET